MEVGGKLPFLWGKRVAIATEVMGTNLQGIAKNEREMQVFLAIEFLRSPYP